VRARSSLVAVALLAAALGRADTDVRRSGDRVDVRATASPLAEVLDRLARQTGMKVIYDGPAPRGRVTVNLSGVTPVQAVLSVLEGQALNYALLMDPAATRVETLLVVAPGGTAAARPVTAVRAEVGPRPFDREREEDEAVDETAPVESGVPPEPAADAARPAMVVPPTLTAAPVGQPAMPLMLPPSAPAPMPSPAPPQNPQD